MKRKNKKRQLGPVVEILFMALIISVLCFLLNVIGTSGYVTEAGSLITNLTVINKTHIK